MALKVGNDRDSWMGEKRWIKEVKVGSIDKIGLCGG